MSFNVPGIAGDIIGHNSTDGEGKPAGGDVQGVGFSIDWQAGPLGRGEDRKPADGAFAEDVLTAVKKRLEFYQQGDDSPQPQMGEFACRENALAITKIEEAIHWLEARTKRRELAGVEGTNEGK